MVWLLLGLLLNAVGLYIGFDSALSFVLIIVGWFCCAFGLALLALRRMEKPKSRENTRLSSNFISTGSSAAMPAMREEECNPENPAP
jgi:Flp pilus assembly protein protease CpaA